MTLHPLTPRKSLNKAFLKVKPNRNEIECFKTNLSKLLDGINECESEEFHKNLVSDFLKDTYYKQNHFINTKGRNDLVIHNGDKASSTVGVIIEAKKPTNKGEMLTKDKLNVKAFQELVLYYLRERVTNKNIEIKYLIATNIYEWFIFDSILFDKLFAQNKLLVNIFNDFESGRLAFNTTDRFYKEIAEPFVKEINQDIQFTYFDIREFEKPLRNTDKKDDNQLIALFKLLSPEHLLKLPFVNDSNSLDKRFYSELLHIIGLTEAKDGSKKLISRNKEGQRNTGSILENAIIQLDSLDKLSRLENAKQFGPDHQTRLFNVGLELSITWINRILFLKLLEAQLISYHKGDKSYEFLNHDKIKDYDDLNSLFFQVLAKRQNERNEDVKYIFSKVPYLNSSLFEPTEIEHATFFISQLRDEKTIPICYTTVLKDKAGKKRSGDINPLQYLFEFLNAYDFASEGSEEIQEENKTLINASVLGLIFEKINGYKDGSFFTPGFITMYMCRETIRRAVIQKFNEVKGWSCTEFDHLYDKIDDRREANSIINSLKICDPAVGSGHFLVSALNEIIAIKSDLKILQDREGRRLKEYHFEVINDELIVTDEDAELFDYNPSNKESQRIQEALFHEKQTIIENCLFGVDLNPNSVKICRLRLWIELLKNSYYKNESELETLPNIDINIKCGNSLISRFALDADLKQALKNSAGKWTIDSYRLAVDTYRNAESKEQKREMERLISQIKTNFQSEISLNDPKAKRLRTVNGELFTLANQTSLFGLSDGEKVEWNKKVEKLSVEAKTLEAEIEEIKGNKIYENAFEWRFEFPEVLDENGDFVGFDVVIGNPPYVQLQKMGVESEGLHKMGFETFARTGDIYSLFYELGYRILKENGVLTFISSNKWMRAGYGESTRDFFNLKTNPVLLIDFAGQKLFDEATVDTNILMFIKQINQFRTLSCIVSGTDILNKLEIFVKKNASECKFSTKESWTILSPIEQSIKAKMEAIGRPLKNWDINIYRGILTGYNEAFIIDGRKKDELIAADPKSVDIIRPILRGRDIKRYSFDFADLWLINAHNGLKEKDIKPVNIDDYPAIKHHLDQFYPDLESRADKGETPYNLRNCAYMDDFFKQKIVWAETMRIHKENIKKFPRFGIENEGKYLLDKTCFFATGNNLKHILAVLNSKVGRYLCSQYVSILDNGGYLMQKIYLEKIPIAPYSKNLEIIMDREDNEVNDDKINQIVYDLYNLTQFEIDFIENLQNQPLHR